MNNNISIFVNGNKNIGYGHIARCLIIANELNDIKFNVKFIIPESCSFKEKIEAQFSVHTIVNFSENELIKLKEIQVLY